MTTTGPVLVVSFVGDERVVTPDATLTFGRAGDLRVDDNPYLHRVVGRFVHQQGAWWLANLGQAIPVTLSDTLTPSFTRLAPGARTAIGFTTSIVSFEAGGRPYEIVVEIDHDVDVGGPEPVHDLEATVSPGTIRLNDEQRQLLAALAEPLLRASGGSADLPTNRQAAARLGWTITKLNRKLDFLCSKFAAGGVAGLRGSTDSLARDRRSRLVDHALHARIITAEDLGRLPPPR